MDLLNTEDLLIEVCLDSADSAVAAQQGGAGRVELCDNLLEGGTAPSAGMIAATREAVDIAVHVMIRPRGGDFCYTDVEFEIMKYDIERAKQLGANGVVFGLLRPDGTIDMERSAELLQLARPMSVTFHRAFDMTRDPFEALDTLIDLGVDRILTSGQEPSVFEGTDLIRQLIERAAGRLTIMPGCGITLKNIHRVIEETGATEFHVAAPAAQASSMSFRNDVVFMGTALRSEEYMRYVTPVDAVRQFAATVKKA